MIKDLRNLKLTFETKLLYLSFFLFAIAVGINFVTFPTVLKSHHESALNIGIASSVETIGAILMSLFLSRFVARIGIMKSLIFSATLFATIVSVIYFYVNFLVWILLILFIGICFFIFAIVRQSWLNMLLNDNQRGLGIGIFSMIISAGVAIGPVITKFYGANNHISFIISASLVIASLLCLLPLTKIKQPKISSERISLKKFLEKNPKCFLAKFFLDMQCFLLLTFSVVYGTEIGFSYESSGLLITAYLASGFFDVFVGFLLKKIKPFRLINIGFLGCFYCFLMILLYHQSYIFLMIIYFIFGLFVACIYVSVYKIVNEDYQKSQLIASNATFQLIGTIGSLCGSLFGGLIINIFGIQGFPFIMVVSCALYISYLVINNSPKSKSF